eukprot:scaffold968_cov389-Pavlova_lutheri.AAC.2
MESTGRVQGSLSKPFPARFWTRALDRPCSVKHERHVAIRYRADVWRMRQRKTTWTPKGLGSGGGVLDRPAPVLPGKDVDRDLDKNRQKKKPPLYRVMLHNDNVNRREYVVQVLMKTVPGMTVDTAVNIMQEAHVNGIACVITTSQQEAEDICEAMRGNGLIASIEPAGKGN